MPKKIKFLSDTNNTPLVLYHGTYYDFDYFRPLTHFGLKINAETNIKEGKWKRNPDIDINNPKIIPVLITDRNYHEIPDLNDHSIQNWKAIIFQYMCSAKIKNFLSALNLTDEQEFQKKHLIEYNKLLNSEIIVPAEFDFICEPVNKNIPKADIDKELSFETLFDIYNNENLFFQRMILYFESIGIHGFKYKNFTEGLGSYSYILFRQSDIHRQDKVLPVYKITKTQKNNLSQIKDKFMSSAKPRILSGNEKQSLLQELIGFYTFRFDEIKRQKISLEH